MAGSLRPRTDGGVVWTKGTTLCNYRWDRENTSFWAGRR